MYLKPIKIGNVELKNNIFLAPMAGITDGAFRKICKEQNAGLVYSEMVSAKGIYYDDNGTKDLLKVDEIERPIAIQIFGSDPKIMGESASEVSKIADIIDINMGCPAPKVVKNMDGSYLMKNPELIYEIVSEVCKNSKVPVTVKIRKGWDKDHVNAVEVAKLIEKAGASAITIHGRTRDEFYSGTADWDIIKEIKQAVSIPVIGNGDITSAQKAKEMFEYTKCDAIMIGRGALGNPWIFNDIINYLKDGSENAKPTIDEIKEMMIKHLDLLVEQKGEYTAIREMRKHVGWYIKGIPNAASIRNEINQIENLEELKNKINQKLIVNF